MPAEQTVSSTTSAVYINGEEKSIEGYNIADNNYFKLRDIAYVFNCTEKQFDITYYSDTDVVLLIRGAPYTAVGGEMSQSDGKPKTATASGSVLLAPDFPLHPMNPPVYNINGSNFFKLEELMSILQAGLTYDDSTNSILINTDNSFIRFRRIISAPVTPPPTNSLVSLYSIRQMVRFS